jgi:hypothetical protein
MRNAMWLAGFALSCACVSAAVAVDTYARTRDSPRVAACAQCESTQCSRITGCTRRRNQWLAESSAMRAKPVKVITWRR